MRYGYFRFGLEKKVTSCFVTFFNIIFSRLIFGSNSSRFLVSVSGGYLLGCYLVKNVKTYNIQTKI